MRPMKHPFVLVTSVVSLLFCAAMFTGCPTAEPLGPDASIDASMMQKCSLTQLLGLQSSNDVSFVGLARPGDGSVLLASNKNVYKVDPVARTASRVAGSPSADFIVDISAASGQPTLVVTGNDLFSLNGAVYTHLASTPPDAREFMAVSQLANQTPLVATNEGVYSFDLTTHVLQRLVGSPDGSFIERISQKAGLPTLISTQLGVYSFASGIVSGTPNKVATRPNNETVIEAVAQVTTTGFVYATETDVSVSDEAGANTLRVATRPNPPDYSDFTSASSAGPDASDILMTTNFYLYRLDLSCLNN